MSDLQLVYVAPNGLVKMQDGINMRMGRLVLASDPAIAKYPDAFTPLGMVDAATAGLIPGLGDEATAKLLIDRIRPITGASPVTDRPRLIPDLERVMREAIQALTSRDTRLTWGAVATEIAHTVQGAESYNESTLRRNAKDERLPHPTDRYWRNG